VAILCVDIGYSKSVLRTTTMVPECLGSPRSSDSSFHTRLCDRTPDVDWAACQLQSQIRPDLFRRFMEYPGYFAWARFNSSDHNLRNWEKWKQLDVNAQRNRTAGLSS
jgi:hypothetical protein